MITEDKILEYQAAISETFNTGDVAKRFELSNQLYNETNKNYSYFLGACYLNGWGVGQNINWAAQLLTGAADHQDNYNYACYLAAIAYYRLQDFENAFEWFCKAEEAGVRDSVALFADSAAGCAFNLWEKVRTAFLQSEVTQGASIVKKFMAIGIELYMEAAEQAPETMNASLYCGYARLLILMYNMGTTGMLDMQEVATDSLSGIVAGGLEALQKMLDTEAHNKVLAKCIIGAHFLEEHGAPLVAEYLRAFLALMESTRDRSAVAFYRARWHMKRIGEMRNTDPDAALVANIFTDIDGQYRLAEHKYSATVMNMMRSGQLPDLTKSFLPGYAPAAESCENFMVMFRNAHSSAQQSATQNPAEKAGGFLKKLFKF